MHLRTFGGLSIEAAAGDGPIPSLSPRRLALLAVVAAASPRGITREKILGMLWAETDEGQARHNLSQTLYMLRRDTGREWIAGNGQLRLHDSITTDIGEFQAALKSERLAQAAELYTGPFLDGFYLPGAPEFEQWVEETRARLQFAVLRALESLARHAVEAGLLDEALTWWRRLGAIDPFNAKYAVGQLRTLIVSGDQTGALRLAREYESRVRRELDAEPDASIVELTAALRATPAPLVQPSESAAAPGANEPSRSATALAPQPSRARSSRRFLIPAAIVIAIVTAAIGWSIAGRTSSATAPPFLAIGSIQSPDTAGVALLLRDMLATNLARIDGLRLVSNSRLLELASPASQVSAAATADAARRAGAIEMVEGEVGGTAGLLVLTFRRVSLRSGEVLQGYTVRAADLYALTDSATAAIASDLRLELPPGRVTTVRTRPAVAYALYEQGLRSFYQSDLPASSRLMSAALERDSTFAMAAFFFWLSNRALQRGDEADRGLRLVRLLAPHAVDRERLWIEATIAEHEAPAAEFLRIAREMAGRFPDDPDGQILLGNALSNVGDWARSIAAYNRAIAIDSAAGAVSGSHCRICSAINGLVGSYEWWDSVGAAERSARRLVRFRPTEGSSWGASVEPLLRQGRRAEAEAAIARADKLSAVRGNFQSTLDRDLIRWGRSDELEGRLVAELRVAPPDLRGERTWLLALSLRNQGRLREAHRLAADGVVPGSAFRLEGHRDDVTLAIVALERGQPLESARRFLDLARYDRAGHEGAGAWARRRTWQMTLAGTALAAAGDTAAVRTLADSVEHIGPNSNTGRDFRLHYFLRGLLLQHQNRHAEAVASFRRSLFSPTEGYTRTNLLMATSLMALRRYPEAIAILQPALRGGVDGSNTYVTHTELHEGLAHAFHAAGQRDSAAVHYTAVERAWRRADPELSDRYQTARARASLR